MHKWRWLKWGLVMVWVLSVGCSSAPAAEDLSDHEPGTTASDDEVLRQAGISAGQEPGQPQPFWGPIQHRADDGFDALEEELTACLGGWGHDDEVRELALWAGREPGEEDYELKGWSIYPDHKDGEGPECAASLAKSYVNEVGPGYFDDFEAYVASFLMRPADSPGCDDEGAQVQCRGLGAEIDEEQVASDTCEEAVMDRVHGAIMDGRDCWSGRHWHPRMAEYEDDPLALRALLFGEVRLEEDGGLLALEYNQPWVEEIALCVADEVEGALEGMVVGACREEIRNRAITFWSDPSFSYMVGGDE